MESPLPRNPGDGLVTLSAPRPGWKPEWVIALLVLLFGLGFTFLMPPCQTPDENAHFLRAYQVSEGQFVPEMVDGRGGGHLPVPILRIAAPFANLPLQPDNHTRLANFAYAWSLAFSLDQRAAAGFPNSAYYSFVPYSPQALGIAAARLLGARPLLMFYAGRLANLALGVVLIFWAIRLTPFFKLVFGIVALIPMTVHQLASHSPDASTIGVAFLLTALFLRLVVLPQPRSGWFTLAPLFTVAVWLTLCKFPYAVMTLLYLAIPSERLGSRRRYIGVGLALLLLVMAVAFAETRFKRFTSDGVPLGGHTASIQGQLDFIRHEPFQYLQVIAASVAEHGKIWLDQLGMLGWLDTYVNPLAMHLLLTFVVLVALGDHESETTLPPLRLRLIAALTVVLGFLVILSAVYITGCPVRAKLMHGIQGRYFLPIAPLLLLPLSNRLIAVETRPSTLLAFVSGIGCAVLFVALAGVIRRYYFVPDADLWMAPLGLGLGSLLGVIVGRVTYSRHGSTWKVPTPEFGDRKPCMQTNESW